MKKALLLAWLLSPVAFASQTLFAPITSSTSSSNGLSNPASGYLMVDRGDLRFGLALLEPVALGYEIGDVDALLDQVDDLQDILDNGVSTPAEATAAKAEFDAFLSKAGEEGYVKTSVAGSVILFPALYSDQRYGSVTLDFSYGGIGKLNILDDPNGVTISGTSLSTESSVYEQRAIASTFGLGYRDSLLTNYYGDLIVGVKLNATQMKLTRKLSTIEYQGENEDEGEETSFNIGADIGVLWVSENMSLGLTMSNINEPKYDLGELGDCTGVSGTALVNCSASQYFATDGDIDLTGHYVAERQTTAEFSLFLASRALSIQSAYDFNPIKDATGDEYQWAEIALNYLSDSFFIPGLRVGLKKNMAGTELSYANAGITLFKYLNIDAGTTIDTVEVSDYRIPRSAYVNFGLAGAF